MNGILFNLASDVKRHGGGGIIEMLSILIRLSLRAYGSLCASGSGAIDDAEHAI